MSVLDIPVLPDTRNIDRKIYSVMQSTPCKRHKASIGSPCWSVSRDSSHIPAHGVCNHRARAAGMRGNISDQAIQSSRQNRMHYAKDLGDRIRSKNFPKSRRQFA